MAIRNREEENVSFAPLRWLNRLSFRKDRNVNDLYIKFFKRLFDIVLSVAGIVVLAIPMIVVALIVKLDSPGPVFFKQKRVGIHKAYFNIIKFRSMPTGTPSDVPTHLLADTEYDLTKWQRFIRKSSIDELPQMFNILAGSMSVVGPRPALWNQYDLLEERDGYAANDVKPGLTGWAQINGRDNLTIGEKAYLDGEYVKQISFAFDCKCFFGTIGKGWRGEPGAVRRNEENDHL